MTGSSRLGWAGRLCTVACGYDAVHGIEGNNLSNVIGRRILVTGI